MKQIAVWLVLGLGIALSSLPSRADELASSWPPDGRLFHAIRPFPGPAAPATPTTTQILFSTIMNNLLTFR